MLDTRPLLLKTDFPEIFRGQLQTLQVNLGYKCNLSCTHCHVNAGPSRTESMDKETVELILAYIRRKGITELDLTGGAPEMNPHFMYLVKAARQMGVAVIDRCNLTILAEPGYEHMAEFLCQQEVTIVASLPCYEQENVEKQRGKGVYWESIGALKMLNQLGYGRDSNLQLNLVFNPDGINLPPNQQELETEYKVALERDHGIVFNRLFTITNVPISRFGGMLLAKGIYHEYMDKLRVNFKTENMATLMCKNLLSVDYQGFVYDCDFNQMLNLPLPPTLGTEDQDIVKKTHLSELLASEETLIDKPIRVGEHCFACTAGQGSSCGGALA